MQNFDQMTNFSLKSSVLSLHLRSWSLFFAVFVALASWCCDDDAAVLDDDSLKDGATDDPVGTDSQTLKAGTGGTEDTEGTDDVGTQDGADEPFPKELKPACSVAAQQLPASEDKPDIVVGPRGDGRHPAVAVSRDSQAVMAWAYKKPDSPGDPWVIQTASYDPQSGVGTRLEPVAPGISARTPALASRRGVFGLVWRDARWDADCDPKATEDCRHSYAFSALDAPGSQRTDAQLQQLTHGRNITTPPVISAAGDCWVVAGAADNAVFTLFLSENGSALGHHEIQAEEGVKTRGPLALAADADRGLVAWIAGNEWSLWVCPLDGEGAALGDAFVIAEGSQIRSVDVVATSKGYVLVWSQRIGEDFEALGLPLSADGSPVGEARRLTWSSGGVNEVDLAWDKNRAALAYVSPNSGDGTDRCVVDSCNEQVFLRLVDENGAAVSQSAQLSADPNPSAAVEVVFDGAGFTAAWETRRQFRQQVYYGRAVCSE